MKRDQRKTGLQGFTLLEIMIALAIISIAMVSLLGLANRSVEVQGRLQRMTEATLLAQKVMAETEVKANRGTLSTIAEQGVFDEPNGAYRWQIDFTETPLPTVQMVTVTVLWGEEERNEQVDLKSFIF